MREGERLEKQWGDEKVWEGERLEKCKCEIKKKYIKNNYKKMERKKIMTWMLTWLNMSAAALNTTFQVLVIYRLEKKKMLELDLFGVTSIS